MKNLFLFIVLFFVSLSTFSQEVRLNGVVLDSSGNTISDVKVKEKIDKKVVFTNMEGIFQLKTQLGEMLIFSKEGFLTQRKVVGIDKEIRFFQLLEF